MQNHSLLIKQVARGNRKAFHQLYESFSDRVYNTAISYVQVQEDAEEVTQDVFVQIHKNATKFEGKSSVSTWIYRITINTSINYIRKKKRLSFLKFEQITVEKPDFEHPGVLLENKENAKKLFKVIDTLADNQKTAFILSFIEGLPRQEVADVMQVSLKSVEGLLQRAKANLRKKLGDLYPHRQKKKS